MKSNISFKKNYAKPLLKRHGDIKEVTKGSWTGEESDGIRSES